MAMFQAGLRWGFFSIKACARACSVASAFSIVSQFQIGHAMNDSIATRQRITPHFMKSRFTACSFRPLDCRAVAAHARTARRDVEPCEQDTWLKSKQQRRKAATSE